MDSAVVDTAEVRAAVRLGWLIAEVRGRARPNGPGPGLVTEMARGDRVLPLGSERSPAERVVESEHALAAVAQRLDADPPVNDHQATGSAPATQLPSAAAGSGPRYSDRLKELSRLLADHRKNKDPQAGTTWDDLAELLYHWDAKIQDGLVSQSDLLANAYELGRALAEAYWALDPHAEPQVQQGKGIRPNPVSWEFLLGSDRRADIARLLSRLANYFPPLTAPAVSASIEIWARVANDKQWRSEPTARGKLYEQVGNWYSLLVVGLDPETMLKPYALLRSWRIFKKTFKAFGLEMVVGLLSVVLLAALALLLVYAPHQPALKAVFGALGFLGITTAGLQARLKATTQSMVARLSQDLSTDLVAEQITVTPAAPVSKLKAKRIRQEAIAARTVTAPLGR